MPAVHMARVTKRVLLLAAVLFVALKAMCDTIPVEVHAVALNGRTVELAWDNPEARIAAVYRVYPGQTVPKRVAETSRASYRDRLERAVCGDTVRYRVAMDGETNVYWGEAFVYLFDNEPTMSAEWGVVTVDSDRSSIVLRWNSSQDTDIMGYMICEGNPSIVIDTVFGRDNTTYIPTGHSLTEVHSFRICAFDSCRQASALTDICNNMVLEVESDSCSRSVVAKWNAYVAMPGGVKRYEVWCGEDGEAMVRKGEAQATDQCRLMFTVGETTSRARIEVRAVGENLTSVSNQIDVSFATGNIPSGFYLCKVSVSDDGSAVNIEAHTDPAFADRTYRLYRRLGSGYEQLVTRLAPSSAGFLTYRDDVKNVGKERYSYRIGVLDGCGRNESFTTLGTTLRPKVENRGENVIVAWDAYDGWTGTTLYEVFVSDGSGERWRSLGTTVSDSLADDGYAGGTACYKVVAYEGTDSEHHGGDSLQSCVACLRVPTNVWTANAFTPLESTNKTFKPQFSFITEDDYMFTIYTRQGIEVFSTTDPDVPWDGTCNGRFMPQGVYVYKLRFMQSDRTVQIVKGSVVLIL